MQRRGWAMADISRISGLAFHPIGRLIGLARAIDRKSRASACTRLADDSQILDHPRESSQKTSVHFFKPFGHVPHTRFEINLLYVTNHANRTEESPADATIKIVQAFDYRVGCRKSNAPDILENLSAIGLIQYEKCLPKLGSAKQNYYVPHRIHIVRNFKVDLHEYQQLFGLFPIYAPLSFVRISRRLRRSNSCGFATRCIGGYAQFPDCKRRRGSNSDSDPGDCERPDSHQSCSEGGTRSPRLPPRMASLSKCPALANAVQFAHSLIPPETGRHFATCTAIAAQPVTLATVKPPRDLRTRLREDV